MESKLSSARSSVASGLADVQRLDDLGRTTNRIQSPSAPPNVAAILMASRKNPEGQYPKGDCRPAPSMKSPRNRAQVMAQTIVAVAASVRAFLIAMSGPKKSPNMMSAPGQYSMSSLTGHIPRTSHAHAQNADQDECPQWGRFLNGRNFSEAWQSCKTAFGIKPRLPFRLKLGG